MSGGTSGGTDGGLLERAGAARVVAILRAPTAERFVAASQVLYGAGCRAVEVTLTTAGAVEALAAVRAALPADAWVGAGTVLTPEEAAAVADAGAQFVVSPVFDPEVLAVTRARGVPLAPGALTPTEIVRAHRAGVEVVKVSPIGSVGGVGYLKQVGAFLTGVPMMPTGGISLDDVPAYLSAGAVAVGLGGPLVGDALLPGGDLDALAGRTAAVMRAAGVLA